MAPLTPEQQARERIDAMLLASGWVVQNKKELDPSAALGVAAREYDTDAGPADYILFVDRRPVGVVEAKKPEEAEKFTVHEEQAEGYATAKLRCAIGQERLPFCYLSTGEITRHWDLRDPKPRAREVFSFHRPETLQGWLRDSGSGPGITTSLRERLTHFPPLDPAALRECQIRAITDLEKSLAMGKPRALVQMATGSGKTCCELVEIHRSVQDVAVDLRMRYELKLPDAIIADTAIHMGIPLITADKSFSKLKPEFEVVLYGK